jgi:cellulose synthase/poly-beta-1,6-N-acetylglucosamine synthase-like glycosyltransferase
MNEYVRILNAIFFFYGVSLSISYLLLAIFSARALNFHMRKNKFVSYDALLSSPNAPSVSLIAPAYNEEKSIVENIRSLLSLHYNNIEVIIVNDGSKDNTLQTMIDAYQLEKVNFAINQQIPGKPIRGIYKAKNPAYSKLIVVDKENGGKADALNAGINISGYDLVTCIDVDCIIEQDGILKMVKPFMEEEVKVIACGGVVRIANSCEIEDGRLIKVHVPRDFIARFQVIEYLRAFLMGRMAWSKMNGLLLISGAMGMFDKRVAIAAGGYNHNTVGEDMELVVRMRRYMAERNLKYKVTYVPDPLCWTEAPSDYKVLSRQRGRWMRGTMETLWLHRRIAFNPRYGLLGLLSYPYWMIYEWLAPIVEFLGLVYFGYLVATGFNAWFVFLFLLLAVYAFAINMSFLAFYYEERTYRQYTGKRDTLRLMLTAMLEPFIYHPRSTWWGLKGNIDKMRGVKSWGEMTRTGFKKPANTK